MLPRASLACVVLLVSVAAIKLQAPPPSMPFPDVDVEAELLSWAKERGIQVGNGEDVFTMCHQHLIPALLMQYSTSMTFISDEIENLASSARQ
jgi:hypothetical protein